MCLLWILIFLAIDFGKTAQKTVQTLVTSDSQILIEVQALTCHSDANVPLWSEAPFLSPFQTGTDFTLGLPVICLHLSCSQLCNMVLIPPWFTAGVLSVPEVQDNSALIKSKRKFLPICWVSNMSLLVLPFFQKAQLCRVFWLCLSWSGYVCPDLAMFVQLINVLLKVVFFCWILWLMASLLSSWFSCLYLVPGLFIIQKWFDAAYLNV